MPVDAKSRKARRQQRYELQEQIGGGGMGTVFRAFDRELHRTVAIKVLHPELSSTVGGLLRLKREVVLASRINDEHVVRVHDFGEVDGKPVIAMDWVDGESLAGVLRRVHRLPPAQVCDLATQVCQALRAIHSAGIVHRDLKPANLLITKRGEVLVSDFGLARSDLPGDTRLSDTGQCCGTPLYMAPEQLAGLPADARSDLYAFGIVLPEMLTGTAALEALDSVREQWLAPGLEKQVRAEELRKLAVLDRVIRGCVRLDRNERYPAAEAVLDDLRAGLSELCLPAAPSTEVTSDRRWIGGRTAVAGGAALTVLIVLAIAVWRHIKTPPDAPAQAYARALGLLSPGSGETEMRAAEKELNSAVALKPEYLPALLAQIDVRIRLYEATADPAWLTKAAQALQSRAAAALPPEQSILFQARIDLLTGLFPRVIDNLKRHPGLLARSAHATRLLGRAQEGSGQLAAAVQSYRAAVRLSPDSWLAHNELGSAWLQSGSLEEARQEFLWVTRLQPLSPAGFSNLGLALMYAGNLAGAAAAFVHALGLQPSPEAYFNLGLATYLSHRYASSIPFFESALRMRPDSEQYVEASADALRHAGKIDAARKSYVRTLALLDARAAKMTPPLQDLCIRALCFVHLRDYASAHLVLEVAQRQQPHDPDVLYAATVLALAEGRKKAAERLLADAVRRGFPGGLAAADPDLEALH